MLKDFCDFFWRSFFLRKGVFVLHRHHSIPEYMYQYSVYTYTYSVHTYLWNAILYIMYQITIWSMYVCVLNETHGTPYRGISVSHFSKEEHSLLYWQVEYHRRITNNFATLYKQIAQHITQLITIIQYFTKLDITLQSSTLRNSTTSYTTLQKLYV